jgi:hypothetical protein
MKTRTLHVLSAVTRDDLARSISSVVRSRGSDWVAATGVGALFLLIVYAMARLTGGFIH